MEELPINLNFEREFTLTKIRHQIDSLSPSELQELIDTLESALKTQFEYIAGLKGCSEIKAMVFKGLSKKQICYFLYYQWFENQDELKSLIKQKCEKEFGSLRF